MNLRVLVISLFVTLCFFTNLTKAAEWVSVGTDSNRTTEIDVSQIDVNSSGVVNFWARTTYISPVAYGKDHVKSTTNNIDIDCKARTMTFKYFITYSENGDVIYSGKGDGASTPIVPDSWGEVQYNFVCRSKEAFPKRRKSPKKSGLKNITLIKFTGLSYA